jgi:hypothetical protein
MLKLKPQQQPNASSQPKGGSESGAGALFGMGLGGSGGMGLGALDPALSNQQQAGGGMHKLSAIPNSYHKSTSTGTASTLSASNRSSLASLPSMDASVDSFMDSSMDNDASGVDQTQQPPPEATSEEEGSCCVYLCVPVCWVCVYVWRVHTLFVPALRNDQGSLVLILYVLGVLCFFSLGRRSSEHTAPHTHSIVTSLYISSTSVNVYPLSPLLLKSGSSSSSSCWSSLCSSKQKGGIGQKKVAPTSTSSASSQAMTTTVKPGDTFELSPNSSTGDDDDDDNNNNNHHHYHHGAGKGRELQGENSYRYENEHDEHDDHDNDDGFDGTAEVTAVLGAIRGRLAVDSSAKFAIISNYDTELDGLMDRLDPARYTVAVDYLQPPLSSSSSSSLSSSSSKKSVDKKSAHAALLPIGTKVTLSNPSAYRTQLPPSSSAAATSFKHSMSKDQADEETEAAAAAAAAQPKEGEKEEEKGEAVGNNNNTTVDAVISGHSEVKGSKAAGSSKEPRYTLRRLSYDNSSNGDAGVYSGGVTRTRPGRVGSSGRSRSRSSSSSSNRSRSSSSSSSGGYARSSSSSSSSSNSAVEEEEGGSVLFKNVPRSSLEVKPCHFTNIQGWRLREAPSEEAVDNARMSGEDAAASLVEGFPCLTKGGFDNKFSVGDQVLCLCPPVAPSASLEVGMAVKVLQGPHAGKEGLLVAIVAVEEDATAAASFSSSSSTGEGKKASFVVPSPPPFSLNRFKVQVTAQKTTNSSSSSSSSSSSHRWGSMKKHSAGGDAAASLVFERHELEDLGGTQFLPATILSVTSAEEKSTTIGGAGVKGGGGGGGGALVVTGNAAGGAGADGGESTRRLMRVERIESNESDSAGGDGAAGAGGGGLVYSGGSRVGSSSGSMNGGSMNGGSSMHVSSSEGGGGQAAVKATLGCVRLDGSESAEWQGELLDVFRSDPDTQVALISAGTW